MGIGTALLNHLIKRAKEKKLNKIHLNVNVTNGKAIHVYQKAGFMIEVLLCNESFVNGKYRNEYRMALFL